MRMEDRDLRLLDPEQDPMKWELMVNSILKAAEPELRRRSLGQSPLLLLTGWFRPTMAASATIAAFAASAILFVGGAPRNTAEIDASIAVGMGMPDAISVWIQSGRVEALDNLVFGVEEEF